MSLFRERTAADLLFVEQAEWWLLHYAHTEALPSGTYDDADSRHRRLAEVAAVQGFSVLYLLAVLREMDPDLADRAARLLRGDAGALGHDLPSQVERWMQSVATGGPVSPPLAPAAGPALHAVPSPRPVSRPTSSNGTR